MNNRDQLIEWIADYKLERLDVAEMVRVDLEQVGRWLASPESSSHDEVPDMAIELLGIKLKMKMSESS